MIRRCLGDSVNMKSVVWSVSVAWVRSFADSTSLCGAWLRSKLWLHTSPAADQHAHGFNAKRAAAAITHDCIIDIYGVSEANGLPYIVMPFARGPSLQNRIDRSGPLTTVEVVRIGKQIAAGLAAAHEGGLVHRDIKPANILLNEGIERLWITDFGVARAMDDASMTKTGVIAGTPQYMSPEQARGESVDHRSDLFSLGSVLYIACTGRAPFRSEAAYGILRRITDTDPRPIREVNPDIPDWLCQIIRRLMAKHPSDRFQSAADVASLLENCLAHLQQPTNVALPSCVASTKATQSIEKPVARMNIVQSNGGKSRIPWMRSAIAASLAPLFLFVAAAFAWQITKPFDITGTWKGETWKTVSLDSVDEASGWYNGTFTDADGIRGAIKLEWSRSQRRYNGRWKSEDEQSGSITLRVDEASQIRGAVSADPESPIRADRPRLRDFSWSRAGAPPAANVDVPPSRANLVAEAMPIQSPMRCTVVRLGNGIEENARVKKGDLIALVSSPDNGRTLELETLKTAMQREISDSRADVTAKSRRVDSASNQLDAAKQRVVLFESIQKEIVAGAEAAIDAEASKADAAKAQLDLIKQELAQLNKTGERTEKMRASGLISEQELQASRAKQDKAKSQVVEAEANLQAILNELKIKESDRNAKRQKAQVDIADAQSSANSAEDSLKQSLDDLDRAKASLAQKERDLEAFEAQKAQQRQRKIVAPVDGTITSLVVRPGDILPQGALICRIRKATNGASSFKVGDPSNGAWELSIETSESLPSEITRPNTQTPETVPELEY